MASAPAPLPSFTEPPVDEVAVALQFDEISSFAVLYGGFYDRVRDRYPNIEEHDPIEVKFETFSDTPSQGGIELIERFPLRRVWFLTSDGQRLVQVQANRIVQNWRKRSGEGVYPRFEAVLDDLWKNHEELSSLVESNSRDKLRVNQCEVSYFNNISLDEGETYAGAFERTFLWPVAKRFETALTDHKLQTETASFVCSFRVLSASGEPVAKVSAAAQPALNTETGKRIIRLTMTFRGPPPACDRQSLNDFLLLGREAIVRTFANITSDECHTFWGRET